MTFSVKDKVAIITGGAGGIGLAIAKELLKNGARGVCLADINEDLLKKALEELRTTRVIFIKTDVRDIKQFEEAFKQTLSVFNRVDILVNNAAILNDSQWSDEIDINLKGTINGMLLGLENYLQTNNNSEAVIVNLSSIAGVEGFGSIPIYSATKFAVHGLTLAWGAQSHYERTRVKVVAICPGGTRTNFLLKTVADKLGAPYEEHKRKFESGLPVQTPEQCAAGAIKVIEHAKSGTVWVIEGGETPYQFILPVRGQIEEKIILK